MVKPLVHVPANVAAEENSERGLHGEDDWNGLKLRKPGRWFGAPSHCKLWCACDCHWHSWSHRRRTTDGLCRGRRRQLGNALEGSPQKATAGDRLCRWPQTHLTVCVSSDKQTTVLTCLVKGHCSGPSFGPQEAINAFSVWGAALVFSLLTLPQMMVLCSRPSQLSIRWNVLSSATFPENNY